MITKTSMAAFVDEIRNIQFADKSTPPDYYETRAAALEKIGGITDFISKHKEPLTHAAEVAGLGILAAPVAAEMRDKGQNPAHKWRNRAELAGLGVLAVPSAAHLVNHFRGH